MRMALVRVMASIIKFVISLRQWGSSVLSSKWKLYGVVVVSVLIIGYITWSFFHKKVEVQSNKFVPLAPTVNTPKVPGPVLKVPLKIVPKKVVKKEYPEVEVADDDSEEVVDTGKVPEAENGGVVVSKINTETGEITSQFKANPAPWFSLEDKNYLGVGYQVSTLGSFIPLYYKRDIFRIKNFHLQGGIGGRVPIDRGKGEVFGEINGEYRF